MSGVLLGFSATDGLAARLGVFLWPNPGVQLKDRPPEMIVAVTIPLKWPFPADRGYGKNRRE